MLTLDDHFKAHEIAVLEASRALRYNEYAASIRENVLQGSVRARFNLQWQVAQASSAMTQEELQSIRMLERTKDLLLGKLEKVAAMGGGGTVEQAEK